MTASLETLPVVNSLEAPYIRKSIFIQEGAVGYSVPITIDFTKYILPSNVSRFGIKFTFTNAHAAPLLPGGIAGMIIDSTTDSVLPNAAHIEMIVRFIDTGFCIYNPYQYITHSPVFTNALDFIVYIIPTMSGGQTIRDFPPISIMPVNMPVRPWRSLRYPQAFP